MVCESMAPVVDCLQAMMHILAATHFVKLIVWSLLGDVLLKIMRTAWRK